MDPLLNAFILVGMGALCSGFVFVTWRINQERLYSAVIILLLLITIAGAKIVPVLGHETNTGNIFYASVFLATYFLVERYGKRAGIRTIGIGVVFVAFFTILLKLTVLLVGSDSTSQLNSAFSLVFAFSPRLALASLTAYVCAQSLNVMLFVWLKARWDGEYLWLRANLANAIAQILDSAIFFSVAFWGVVPPVDIFDILVTGYLIKIIYMMLVSPLLYFNTLEEEEDEDGERGFFTLRFLR